MGRHSKLDDAALETVREAARHALSEREIIELVGVSRRVWQDWKRRAELVAEVLPEQWRELKYDELVAVCEELEINLASVKRTGSGKRHTREDLIGALRARAERYTLLMRELEQAKPHKKLAILRRIDDLLEGRAKIVKKRTTQRVFVDKDGRTRPTGEAIITTEEILLPPDRQALLKMLEMQWPEEFNPRRQGVGDTNPVEAGAAAKTVTDAVHQMLSSVSPPALPTTTDRE